MLKIMKDGKFAQIAFVVNDVETAKRTFTELYGFDEVPPTCGIGEPDVCKTQYLGKSAPEIDCKIAYFNFNNIQIELMEPNKAPSAWRTWLDAHGDSLHHLSYFVKDAKAQIGYLEQKGMKLLQYGDFADGSGFYAYLDTQGKLPYLIELLEIY